MNWETVKISNNSRGKTTAYASVGFGRLSLSCGACQLIKDYENYSYAEILKARRDGKLCIGIRMLKEPSDNCIRVVRRKVRNETIIFSGDISNKPLMEELFGIEGVQNKATRHSVTLDPDSRNVLVIFGE